MQIIIVQSEIEEAIRNHILGQITVKEDMEINIDLRATRGDLGFQATINITKAGAEAPEPVAEPEPEAPVASAPLGIVERATRARRTPATAKAVDPAPEPAEEPAEKLSPTAGLDAADEAEAAAEEAPAKPSLFGNLKKPVNNPATTDA